MYVENGWLSLDPIYTPTNSWTISRTWMDFKMADTSERRGFCNTILLKYHDLPDKSFSTKLLRYNITLSDRSILERFWI